MKINIGSRIKRARKLRLMSQQQLADKLNLSKNMISKYEKQDSIPNSSILIKLAKALNLNINFFTSPVNIDLGDVKFRKKSSFPQKSQDSLKEEVKLYLENYLTVEKILGMDVKFQNPISSYEIREKNDLIDAVRKIRESWHIGMDPVHNVIQILEHQGIKILEVKIDSKFDGFSTFVNDVYPVIVINKNWITERKRFTLLHELGHLLLNFQEEINEKEEEKMCNFFAGEFLLPQGAVFYEFGESRNSVSFPELRIIQEKYGISVSAQIYRLKDNGFLNDSSVRNFFIRHRTDKLLRENLDKSRFGSTEESRQFKQLVYRALDLKQLSISKAASLLNIDIAQIEQNLSNI